MLHAFAQLADDRRLELTPPPGERSRLELLARAYALRERVDFDAPQAASGISLDRTPGRLVEELSAASDPPSGSQRADEALAGHRVAMVTNVPAPYRIPLFNTMARRLAAVGGELRVFFQNLESASRPWIGSGGDMEFGYEVMRSVELPMGFRRPRVSISVARALEAFAPTVVLCGSLSPLVTPQGRPRRAPPGRAARPLERRGGVAPDGRRRPKRLVREWIAAKADFGVAYGFQAGEYLRGLIGDLPIVYGRNSSAAYATGRDRPGRPDVVELLAVADMAVPGKGVGTLVDALRAHPELPCRLTIVGGGEAARAEMEERTREDGRIRFLGSMPQAKVRECYAQADVYLFPSQIDVFGLALVEAMGSGLAPVTSTRPGVASDLAVHERNCLAVERNDASAWGSAIERVVADHELRLALGAAAQQTIARRWTIDHACEAMFAGLRLGLLTGRSAMSADTRLVVLGPLPPPSHGVSVSTSLVLANERLRERFDVEHLDTTDRRSGANIGTWDVQNVILGVRARWS